MNQADIEAALQAAFSECEVAGVPLSDVQQQILLQVAEVLSQHLDATQANLPSLNPLDDLTTDQRQALLEYVAAFEQNDTWKAQLLNDWLQGRDSGPVQFIRDRYGPQWLEQIQPIHLAAYADSSALRVKIGDYLEVSNSLWEWVPSSASSHQEWFSCKVVWVFEETDTERSFSNCTVRLGNGLEYDINGMYDWNRPNWRWPQK